MPFTGIFMSTWCRAVSDRSVAVGMLHYGSDLVGLLVKLVSLRSFAETQHIVLFAHQSGSVVHSKSRPE